jgi:hypothetical protein
MPASPLNPDLPSLDLVSLQSGVGTRTISGRDGNLPWILACLTLLLVFFTANFKLVSGAQGPLWDADVYFGPAFTLVADHARAGRIMLWNPWIAAGSPDYAEPELGATSPVTVLVGLVFGGTSIGFRAYYLLIWFLGPLGMLLLARYLSCPAWAALIVSLGIAFSGFYTGHAQHTCWLYSISFLPWIVWRFDASIVRHRYSPAVQGGALWGLSALGGYPGHTILTLGLLLLWAFGRCVFAYSADAPDAVAVIPKSNLRLRLSFAARSLALLVLIGLVVLSPAYVAFFVEGHGFGDRIGTRSREEALTSNTTPLGALTSFSSPYVAKLAAFNRTMLWTNTDATMISIYMGALIPIFAILAIFERPRSPWRWWLAGMMVFLLASAAGNQLPLRGWLYDYIVPTRYFRNAALFRGHAIFCASVLALLALKDLSGQIGASSSGIWKRLAASAVLTSAVAVASYFYIVHRVVAKGDLLRWAGVQFAVVWFGAALIAMAALKWPILRKLLPGALVGLALIDSCSTMSVLQGGALQMISSAGASWDVWKHLNKVHDPNLVLTANGLEREISPPGFWLHPNNKNVPVKVPTFENYETMWNRFEMNYWQHPVLTSMSTGADRIWFATDVATVTPTDAYYQAFVNRSEALKIPVVIIHPPEEMDKIREHNLVTGKDQQEANAIQKLPPAERLAIRLLRYTPNHLDFAVSCPRDGWLLVTDRWAHGWSARVNRQPADVFGGNFIFRVLRVHAGLNDIEFSYWPAGWPILVIASWGTMLVVFITPFITTYRRSRLRTEGL